MKNQTNGSVSFEIELLISSSPIVQGFGKQNSMIVEDKSFKISFDYSIGGVHTRALLHAFKACLTKSFQRLISTQALVMVQFSLSTEINIKVENFITSLCNINTYLYCAKVTSQFEAEFRPIFVMYTILNNNNMAKEEKGENKLNELIVRCLSHTFFCALKS